MLPRLLPHRLSRKSVEPGGPPRRSNRRSEPRLEPLEARVVLYSASGNAWPSPALVTLSFMPDGTNFGGKTSNLDATLKARFGSTAAWENVVIKAAQTWAAQTNINFAVVPDDGASEGSGSNQQGDPGFGDIRIGGYNFGSSSLAQAFMPPPVNNYSVAGDVAFNTGQVFNSGSTYDLFTVATHEIGHALGLYHSGIASAEMYSSYNGVKNALTSDDVAGIRSIYSDGEPRAADAYFNTTGGTPNFASAYDITSKINTSTLTAQLTNGTISSAGASDLFAFTVPAGAAGNTLKVAVQSKGLSLLTPGFMVYNASQNQIASAQGVAAGDTINSTWSGLAAGSKIYVKVFSPVATVFGTGAYALTLNLGPNATPSVPLPNTTDPNGSPLSSGGGQAVKVNLESQVNTYTAGSTATTPDRNAVAMDAQGNYVVVWASQNQDGSGWGVYAQRFNATGAKVAAELRVNTTTAGDQQNPSVAMDAAGDFVVTWQSHNQDGGGAGVYARSYSATGLTLSGEFRVNSTTADDQSNPSVATDSLGNFIIAWQSHNQDGSGWGVYAQRYTAAALPVGGEFRVNTYTTGDQTNPSVATDSLGNFTIAWQSQNQDGGGAGVYAQRYGVTGLPVGGEFQVNTYTTSDQTNPQVGMAADGDFVVTWQSNGQDGNGLGVYAQRYAAGGSRVGDEFRVNTTTAGDQQNPSVAMDDSGDLLVTWTNNASTSWTIFGQQYSAAGVPLGGEFTVNSTTGSAVNNPSVVMNDRGNVVAAWSKGSLGVFAQQFTISFNQESSDAFFAQGDPNDPDQVHSGPTAVAPQPGPSGGPGDHDLVVLSPGQVDRVLSGPGDLVAHASSSHGRRPRLRPPQPTPRTGRGTSTKPSAPPGPARTAVTPTPTRFTPRAVTPAETPATPPDAVGIYPESITTRQASGSVPRASPRTAREVASVSTLLLRPPSAPAQSPERRTFPRQRVTTAGARIAWRDQGFRFDKACASLIDFSEGGARVLTPVYPRVGRTLWIGLKSLPYEWVKAEVRSSDLSGNQWVCRLEFVEPCPAGILEAVREQPPAFAGRHRFRA